MIFFGLLFGLFLLEIKSFTECGMNTVHLYCLLFGILYHRFIQPVFTPSKVLATELYRMNFITGEAHF